MLGKGHVQQHERTAGGQTIIILSNQQQHIQRPSNIDYNCRQHPQQQTVFIDYTPHLQQISPPHYQQQQPQKGQQHKYQQSYQQQHQLQFQHKAYQQPQYFYQNQHLNQQISTPTRVAKEPSQDQDNFRQYRHAVSVSAHENAASSISPTKIQYLAQNQPIIQLKQQQQVKQVFQQSPYNIQKQQYLNVSLDQSPCRQSQFQDLQKTTRRQIPNVITQSLNISDDNNRLVRPILQQIRNYSPLHPQKQQQQVISISQPVQTILVNQTPKKHSQPAIFIPPLSLNQNKQVITSIGANTSINLPCPSNSLSSRSYNPFTRRSQSLASDPFICLSERTKIFNGAITKMNKNSIIKEELSAPMTERCFFQEQKQYQQQQLEQFHPLTERSERQMNGDSIIESRNDQLKQAQTPKESIQSQLNMFRQLLHVHDEKQQGLQSGQVVSNTIIDNRSQYQKQQELTATDRLECIQTQIENLKGQLLKKVVLKDRSISAGKDKVIGNNTSDNKFIVGQVRLKDNQTQELSENSNLFKQLNNQKVHNIIDANRELISRWQNKNEMEQIEVADFPQQLALSSIGIDPKIQQDVWTSESESGSEDTRISTFERQVECQDLLFKQSMQRTQDLRDSLVFRAKIATDRKDYQVKRSQEKQQVLQRNQQQLTERYENEMNRENNMKIEKIKIIENQQQQRQKGEYQRQSTASDWNHDMMNYKKKFNETKKDIQGKPKDTVFVDDCFTEFDLSSCGDSELEGINIQQQAHQQRQQDIQFSQSNNGIFMEYKRQKSKQPLLVNQDSETAYYILKQSDLVGIPVSDIVRIIDNYQDSITGRQQELRQAEKIMKKVLISQGTQQSTLVQFLIKDISAKLNYIQMLQSQLENTILNHLNIQGNQNENSNVNREKLIDYALKYQESIEKAINRILAAFEKIKQAGNKNNYYDGKDKQLQDLSQEPTRDRKK